MDENKGPGKVPEQTPEPVPVKECVGEILRKERERRDVSIYIIAKDLRLNPRFIEAIETNDYDLLPGDAYIRVYLRSLCKYFSLNADELLERFFKERGLCGVDTLRKDSKTKINIAALKEKEKPNKTAILAVSVFIILALLSYIATRQRWFSTEPLPPVSAKIDTAGLHNQRDDSAARKFLKSKDTLSPDSLGDEPAGSAPMYDTTDGEKTVVVKARTKKEIRDSIRTAKTRSRFIKDSILKADAKNKPAKDSILNAEAKNKFIKDSILKAGAKNKLIMDEIAKAEVKKKLVKDSITKAEAKNKLVKDSINKAEAKNKLVKDSITKAEAKKTNSSRIPSTKPRQKTNSSRIPSTKPRQKTNSSRIPSTKPRQKTNSSRIPSTKPRQKTNSSRILSRKSKRKTSCSWMKSLKRKLRKRPSRTPSPKLRRKAGLSRTRSSSQQRKTA